MDPFGNLPVFHALLQPVEPRRRLRVMTRELLIAFGVLLVFLFGGTSLLQYLGLKEATLSIAGGLILFLIALGMVFPLKGFTPNSSDEDGDPFLVPLAIPLIAGPSAVAVLLLMVSHAPERITVWLAALTCAWLLTSLVLLASDTLYRHIGDRGARAIEKLMGMILIMMAVQMFLDGVRDYLSV